MIIANICTIQGEFCGIRGNRNCHGDFIVANYYNYNRINKDDYYNRNKDNTNNSFWAFEEFLPNAWRLII